MAVPYAEFSDPQTLNLYSYVRNLPTSKVDKDGHCVEDLCIGEVIVVSAAVKWGVGLFLGAVAAVVTYNNFSNSNKAAPPPPPVSQANGNAHAPSPPGQQQNGKNNSNKQNQQQNQQGGQQKSGSTTQSLPRNAQSTLEHIDQTGSAPKGQHGGGTWANDGRGGGQVLPKTNPGGNSITYQEWDVNPKQAGVTRGSERLIKGNDGSAYYTNDHYTTFTKIR